jgi:hypothetical protein
MAIEVNSAFDDVMLYYRDDPIQEHQFDFLSVILHELQHGLGIDTYWGYIQDNDLIPNYGYHMDINDVLTFLDFDETLFDKFLVSLNKGGDLITE